MTPYFFYFGMSVLCCYNYCFAYARLLFGVLLWYINVWVSTFKYAYAWVLARIVFACFELCFIFGKWVVDLYMFDYVRYVSASLVFVQESVGRTFSPYSYLFLFLSGPRLAFVWRCVFLILRPDLLLDLVYLCLSFVLVFMSVNEWVCLLPSYWQRQRVLFLAWKCLTLIFFASRMILNYICPLLTLRCST